jgi:hypothetical protein
MLHGFMRSVTGSLSRLAMQHVRRELHEFSSTTTEVLISEVEIIWMLTPLRAASAEYQPIGAVAAFSDISLRWLGKGG